MDPLDAAIFRDMDPEAFARLLGTSTDRLSPGCLRLLGSMDFRHRVLKGEERDALLTDVIRRILEEELPVSGEARREAWEKGWGENLRRFVESGGEPEQLVPGYIRPGQLLRFAGEYIAPCQPDFLWNFYTVYRRFVFEEYLAEAGQIFEFGCGPCTNLLMMAELFPGKRIVGADWSHASVALAERVAVVHGLRIEGRLFDMFRPDYRLDIGGGAVITLNALEQLGEKHEAFLSYLLSKGPAVVVNSEPFAELYDEGNLLDSLALRYHRKRGYLEVYLTRLRELEAEGKIEILGTKRVSAGSLFHEGYSLVVWRPIRKPVPPEKNLSCRSGTRDRRDR